MRMARISMVTVGILLSASLAIAQDKKDGDKKDGDKKPHQTTTKVEVGTAAPNFELQDIDGKTVKLADFKDKVVVLEWFNCDCPAVKGALPTIKKTAEEFKAKGVIWIAVDSTKGREAKKNAEFKKEHGLISTIVMDTDGKVGHLYGATNTPQFVIINKGTVAYTGAIDDGAMGKPGTRVYVAEALSSVLKGEEVKVKTTKPYGCSVKY